MSEQKLKIKIGMHEFEAEGPTEVVQQQLVFFREMVQQQPAGAPSVEKRDDVESKSAISNQADRPSGGNGELLIGKIMRLEGRLVSLTARGSSLDDEIMLILLGQRLMRQNDSVSGAEIMDGLRLTGRTVRRIDYQLDKMTDLGDVITVGSGRARRYRLTNQGFAKAQEMAMDLVATVA